MLALPMLPGDAPAIVLSEANALVSGGQRPARGIEVRFDGDPTLSRR